MGRPLTAGKRAVNGPIIPVLVWRVDGRPARGKRAVNRQVVRVLVLGGPWRLSINRQESRQRAIYTSFRVGRPLTATHQRKRESSTFILIGSTTQHNFIELGSGPGLNNQKLTRASHTMHCALLKLVWALQTKQKTSSYDIIPAYFMIRWARFIY